MEIDWRFDANDYWSMLGHFVILYFWHSSNKQLWKKKKILVVVFVYKTAFIKFVLFRLLWCFRRIFTFAVFPLVPNVAVYRFFFSDLNVTIRRQRTEKRTHPRAIDTRAFSIVRRTSLKNNCMGRAPSARGFARAYVRNCERHGRIG